MFITFEGNDGCGKSTQARMMYEYLSGLGHDCILTKEPGDTDIGAEIRHILLNSTASRDCLTDLILFTADRYEHIKQVIEPALLNKQVVICDR